MKLRTTFVYLVICLAFAQLSLGEALAAAAATRCYPRVSGTGNAVPV